MSESAGLLFALLLPWLAGVQACRYVLPATTGWAFLLGAGYFVGFAMAAALVWLQDALTGAIGFTGPSIALVVVAAVAWFLARHQGKPFAAELPSPSWSLVAGMALLFALFVAPVIVDVWFRPMFPWDAWYTYALQAKVYTHLGELVEFVHQYEWRNQSSERVFNTSVQHGLFVPLVQTWMGLGLGRWSESLVNLPWPGAWMALAMLTGGTARSQGLGPGASFLAGAAIIALPMAGVHAVLAGYAELWQTGFGVILAASLAAAAAAGGQDRARWLLLAAVAAAATLSTKKYSIALIGLMILAWLLAILTRRAQWALLSVVSVTGIATLFYLSQGAPFDLFVSVSELGELGFRDQVFHAPGMPNLQVQARNVGAEVLLPAIFFSANFLLVGWVSLGLAAVSLNQFASSARVRFLVYWLLIIVMGAWGVFSYTNVANPLASGMGQNRPLLVLLTITFAIAISGFAGRQEFR